MVRWKGSVTAKRGFSEGKKVQCQYPVQSFQNETSQFKVVRVRI